MNVIINTFYAYMRFNMKVIYDFIHFSFYN